MPIELIDTLAQKRYREEMEAYREKLNKKFERQPDPPGWPVRPSPPKPVFSSKAEPPPNGFTDDCCLGSLPGDGIAQDPRYRSSLPGVPADGTAHSEVEGHDTAWTSCEDAPAKPFTLKK